MTKPKHTIPQAMWYNYPVLSEYETMTVAKYPGMYEVELRIGRQDGFWVTGYAIMIGGSSANGWGKSCAPSRKWGEYDKRQTAIADSLNDLLSVLYFHHLKYPDAKPDLGPLIKLMQKRVAIEQHKQLNLF